MPTVGIYYRVNTTIVIYIVIPLGNVVAALELKELSLNLWARSGIIVILKAVDMGGERFVEGGQGGDCCYYAILLRCTVGY